MQDDDDLLFEDDDVEEELSHSTDRWKLLIVDDEPSVHDVTKLALEDFTYGGKALDIIQAYSGKEAKQIMQEHNDVAVVLLDVVMESDHAGLDVVKYIREELHNPFSRIVLRTGQPGQAPERQVILDYDINDYKEKTELTSKKLFTTLVTALRAYRHLMTINRSRIGLEKIIDATASLFKLHSMERFIAGLLDQLLSILNLEGSSFYCHSSFVSHALAQTETINEHIIVAGTGDYEAKINQLVGNAIDPETVKKINQARQQHCTLYFDNECIINFKYLRNYESFVYLRGNVSLDDVDKKLIETFCINVSIAYENMFVNMPPT